MIESYLTWKATRGMKTEKIQQTTLVDNSILFSIN